jgi:hypothetical protein
MRPWSAPGKIPRVPGLARGRITRRRFALAGIAGIGGAAAALYGPLAVGDGFEQLVAARLGIDEQLATELLERARDHYGAAEYDVRAAAFALCFRGPTSAVAPESARRSAAEALVQPMLSDPVSNLAYAVRGRDPNQAACSGLLRPS